MRKTKLQKELLSLQEDTYRQFHLKLVPGIDAKRVIGIRVPILRKCAKRFMKTAEKDVFLKTLPHTYYEEDMIHVLLLNEEKNFKTWLRQVETFLPYVDNWAICDGFAPKCVRGNETAFLPYIHKWIASSHTYTCRFAIGMLMKYYLNASFQRDYANLVLRHQREDYYVQMMIAWYFATALAKHYERILPILEQHKLEPWTHNKTIQKAIESYRLTPEQKQYLKTLRV